MIPGLGAIEEGEFHVVLSVDRSDVDIASELANPVVAGKYLVLVRDGVTISCSSTPTVTNNTVDPVFALSVENLPSGSEVKLTNRGRIQGSGGRGGDGEADTGTVLDENGDPMNGLSGGGGGGGAGDIVGPGGSAAPTGTGTSGSDGTTSAGGSAGVNGDAPLSDEPFGLPTVGGNAVRSGSIPIEIDNVDGEIWAGGGGGIPGYNDGGFALQPTAGGGVGETSPGSGTLFAGTFAGFAVYGDDITFLSGGSDPNTKGRVGT